MSKHQPLSKTVFLASIMILAIFSCNSEHSSSKKTPERSDKKSKKLDEDKFLYYNQHDEVIKTITKQYNLDWILIKSVIIKESHFDPNYISTTGAVGLMQLMPRNESYFSSNYESFIKSRGQKRNSSGQRVYNRKQDHEWAQLYQNELDSILNKYRTDTNKLFAVDQRFNNQWNINSGTQQLAQDYSYFKKRGHGKYGSRIYALAAYNAGRGAVVRSKENGRLDKIPVNRQTELYVGLVERIYSELLKQNGKINSSNDWLLKL